MDGAVGIALPQRPVARLVGFVNASLCDVHLPERGVGAARTEDQAKGVFPDGCFELNGVVARERLLGVVDAAVGRQDELAVLHMRFGGIACGFVDADRLHFLNHLARRHRGFQDGVCREGPSVRVDLVEVVLPDHRSVLRHLQVVHGERLADRRADAERAGGLTVRELTGVNELIAEVGLDGVAGHFNFHHQVGVVLNLVVDHRFAHPVAGIVHFEQASLRDIELPECRVGVARAEQKAKCVLLDGYLCFNRIIP